MNPVNVNEQIEVTLRKYWKDTIVFTDIIYPFDIQEQKLSKEELLPGEESAVIFTVGCYMVRSARRIYRVYEPGYSPELEMPASREEVESFRKNLDLDGDFSIGIHHRDNSLRVTHEISARHVANPNQAFTYICRAAEARNHSWCEWIETICTAKEHEQIPDEYASLLVCMVYSGSSFGCKTWYKIDPTGRITELRLHPFDEKIEEARFSDIR